MKVGHLDRVRDDGYGAAILLKLRDREADSLNADRSFVDRVLLDFFWQVDVQPPVFGIGNAVEGTELADAIDMALNDVTAKTAIGFHRKFKIYERALVN